MNPGQGGSQVSTSSAPAPLGQTQQKEFVPTLSLEEEEARLKPGSLKEAVFKGLKALGLKGASVDELMAYCTQQGIKTQWAETAKKSVAQVWS